MQAINTAASLEVKKAIASGFRFRVEIGNAGDLSHGIAWFCRTIQDARRAFRANRNRGNMAMVLEHFSADDLGNNKELFRGFIQ